MEWESASDEDKPEVSTDELGAEVFASTIQASRWRWRARRQCR
jgi:hypothetical protein